MKHLLGASFTIALAAVVAMPAVAADLPEVKVSASNAVPACATPGRLMGYLHTRNGRINDRFDGIATAYMRYGEELGIRWDVAFFQMILETGALSFTGDVRATQNNFAGLGASGGGNHGERFPDIASGVKAHLQHLLMYAGEHIDDPVADRTRKVQEWGVLTDWQKSIKGPMTYTLVAKQWAPGSRNYVRDIATISDEFYEQVCNTPDPRPELVAEARMGREQKPATQVAAVLPDAPAASDPAAGEPKNELTSEPANEPKKVSGAEIARAAIEEARKEDAPRTGLGAAGMLGTAATAARTATTEPPAQKAEPAVTLLNPTKPDTPEAETTAKADTPAAKVPPAKGADIQTASVAGTATQMKLPTNKSMGKCKVWTASYGGQRAIIIKASTQGTVNYTVLDVNETTEKREVDAYISAYAKGGQQIGAFPSQTKALDKAFELCPEG